MDTSCGISVNVSQLPSATTPLHIVLWKGVDTATPTVTSSASGTALNLETNDTIKHLLDRITVLEGVVTGLLETQKSSIWFSQGLRPTPTGIEVVSRRESMGAESDIGTVLSQLVRPSGFGNTKDIRAVTIAPSMASAPRGATGPEPEAEEEEAVEEAEEEQVEEEQVEEEEEAEEQVEEATPSGLEEAVEEDEQVEEEEAAEEEVEEEEATPSGLEVEEDEQAEEAVEEEEEQVVEYKQIEWKGQSYWVDENQQVYEMDSDGEGS